MEQRCSRITTRKLGALLILPTAALFTSLLLFRIRFPAFTDSTRSKEWRSSNGTTESEQREYGSALGISYPQNRLSYLSSASELEAGLPEWLVFYFAWHREMRAKFPDTQLLEHPDSPGVYIFKDCSEATCGGLFDRLGGDLPFVFVEAARTERVLLFKWIHPMPLEKFLVPNCINWTAPHARNVSIRQGLRSPRPRKGSKEAKRIFNLTLPLRSHFGNIWNYVFRPSPRIERELENIFKENSLTPGEYTATHIRVRHPAFLYSVAGAGEQAVAKHGEEDPDISGVVFDEEMKEKLVKPAIHALQCSQYLNRRANETIFFFSDSEDLVKYLTFDVKNASECINATAFDLWAFNATANYAIVSRSILVPSTHLDFRKQGWEAYASVFVDLYIASWARCLSYGLGRFGFLAARISGIKCLNHHQTATERDVTYWNMWESMNLSPECPLGFS